MVDAAGEVVGEVKTVRGRALHIDAPWRPDYWLRDEAVAAVTDGVCWLAVTSRELGPYRVDDPDATISPHDGYAPGYQPSGVGPVRAEDDHTGQQPAEFRTAGLGGAPVEEVPGVRIERG